MVTFPIILFPLEEYIWSLAQFSNFDILYFLVRTVTVFHILLNINVLSLFDRFIVPMKNGDLDSKGLLASLVSGEGTVESFKVNFF